MNPRREEEERLIQYLLGELPEEERLKVEEKYFLDDESFEELQIVERELVDRYVEGELSEEDQARVERFFLSSRERSQKLRFAVAFKVYASRKAVADKSSGPGVANRIAQWLYGFFTFPAKRPKSLKEKKSDPPRDKEP